jgi:hypothetical protein
LHYDVCKTSTRRHWQPVCYSGPTSSHNNCFCSLAPGPARCVAGQGFLRTESTSIITDIEAMLGSVSFYICAFSTHTFRETNAQFATAQLLQQLVSQSGPQLARAVRTSKPAFALTWTSPTPSQGRNSLVHSRPSVKRLAPSKSQLARGSSMSQSLGPAVALSSHSWAGISQTHTNRRYDS